MKILEDIVEDIKKIEQIVKREAFSGHKMLEKSTKELESPFFLSPLLLISAKFNQYCYDDLEPIAVGLELLNFGVKRHYQANFEGYLQDYKIDNLSLIAGDYYYARGISFASQLERSFVVEIMSQAIIEISEAQVGLKEAETYIKEDFFEKYGQSLSKQAALHSAACKLGALIGGADSRVSKSLEKFGQSVGILYRFFENTSWLICSSNFYEKNIKSFVEDARKSLQPLPENKYRHFFTGLVEEIV
jgi:hypothetical protein